MRRRSHHNRDVIPKRDDADRTVLEPLCVVANHRLGGRVLLKVLLDHEMIEIAIAVEILHVDVHHIGCLDAIAGFERAFDGAAGLEVSDPDAIEGLALAGLDHLVVHDCERIAVDQYSQSRLELIGRVAGHFSSARQDRTMAALKRARMITASTLTRQPDGPPAGESWQWQLGQAITDPLELLQLLDLDPQLAPAARDAAVPFRLRVPRGFVRRMRPGDANDPLLLQVLPGRIRRT